MEIFLFTLRKGKNFQFTEWKFSGLRYVNRKNFQFTEWKFSG